MQQLASSLTLPWIVSVLSALAILRFIIKFWQHRRMFKKLEQRGLPMPPHNFVLGHIGLVMDIAKGLPHDFHGHYLAREVQKKFPSLPPDFYLDLWPTGPPVLVITSAAGAQLISEEPKHDDVLGFLQPLIGKHGLVTMEGNEWKYWRSIFNPGFNAAHLATLVPGIVGNTAVLVEILEQHAASGERFLLFEAMSRLTMDMSCLATLGSRLNAQKEGCELVSAFRSQAAWIPSPNERNLLRKFNPFRHIVYAYNRWRMDNYVSHELDRHFAAHAGGVKQRSKAVVDLALETYLSQQGQSSEAKSRPPTMDVQFKRYAVSQMKLFLFAGYDTTASLAVYAIHLLTLNPDSMSKIRDEHDAILGSEKYVTGLISQNPVVLNRLPYTAAVIKETLRLYPPVSSTRKASPGFKFVSTDGEPFETEGFMLWGVHQAIHRSPELWSEPDSFIPSRWLDGAPHHDKDAWRPFEKGPRNCIGQELAVLEVKVILAMVLRGFSFADAYAEHDGKIGRTGPTTVRGDAAYQVLLGSSKPNSGYPCRIVKRSESGPL